MAAKLLSHATDQRFVREWAWFFIALTVNLPGEAPEETRDGKSANEADVAFNYRSLITVRDKLARKARAQSLKNIVNVKTK